MVGVTPRLIIHAWMDAREGGGRWGRSARGDLVCMHARHQVTTPDDARLEGTIGFMYLCRCWSYRL